MLKSIEMRIKEIKILMEEALYLNDGSYELLANKLEELESL